MTSRDGFDDEPVRSLAEIEASLPEDMRGKPIIAPKRAPSMFRTGNAKPASKTPIQSITFSLDADICALLDNMEQKTSKSPAIKADSPENLMQQGIPGVEGSMTHIATYSDTDLPRGTQSHTESLVLDEGVAVNPSGGVGGVDSVGIREGKGKMSDDQSAGIDSFDFAELPPNCDPRRPEKYYVLVFNVARHLRGLFPDATAHEGLHVIKQWHDAYVATHPGSEWTDVEDEFKAAWSRIRLDAGQSFANQIKEQIDMDRPIPEELRRLFYNAKEWSAIQCCHEASLIKLDGVFFMSCRSLASMVDVEYKTAARMLKKFVDGGILDLVEKTRGFKKGEPGSGKASSYRFSTKGKELLSS